MGSLTGKKIAILLENEYVPGEIAEYRRRFGELGADVHFMSRLWGQKKQTFVSDIDGLKGTLAETRKQLQFLDVDIDFEHVHLDDYAAVIMAANYTSVRLRYFEAPPGQAISPELVRSAPAVRFFANAMRNPRIVKGALCHGLWILTPTPELLAGRRVICHEVVLADIANAGAIFTASSNNVVVDGDLVTGRSWHEVGPFVDAIAKQIVHREQERTEPSPNRTVAAPDAQPGSGSRRVLFVLSEWGYWGEELLGPLEACDAAGYQADFATPTGRRPIALAPSKDASYIDPPLNRPVTTEEVARKVRILDDTSPQRSEQSRRLDHPISLAELMPERPYWAESNFVRKMEAYHQALDAVQKKLTAYDAIVLVGGSGPMVDMVNNQRVHDLILNFYRAGKPIAAECYGVACLAFARNIEDRKSIIWGKRVTGHCLEYDYKSGTGFEGPHAVDGSNKGFGDGYINFGAPFYPLEYILRDATGPDGAYVGNFGHPTSVIVDYPFITGRSTPDSYLTGQKLVEVLEHGLKRYGW
ncbi:MAG TPA: DJ-1/PfpI family protein [Gemmataceae bacterium]|nr:DJ-1/PfpI family protein [Gemmataceae bacterium]